MSPSPTRAEEFVGIAPRCVPEGGPAVYEALDALPAPSYVTDRSQAEELRLQAIRCRRLAHATTDQKAIDTLLLMAREYDEKAARLVPSD